MRLCWRFSSEFRDFRASFGSSWEIWPFFLSFYWQFQCLSLPTQPAYSPLSLSSSDAVYEQCQYDAGILHNCGDQPLWIVGKLGEYTTETPEVRWTSGNPGDDSGSNDGHYIGLKLPAGIAEDTTYTFPLADGEAQQVLGTDGAGQLVWQESIHRIQDADDFALNDVIPNTNRRGVWSEEWPAHVEGQDSDFPTLPGRWTSYDYVGTTPESVGKSWIFVTATDSEGASVDVADVLADPTSYGIIIIVDGVAQAPVRLAAASEQANGYRYRFDWLTADLSANNYGEIYDVENPAASPGPYSNNLEIYFELWTDGLEVIQVPLAEGDTLQWNNIAQKFKPAQLPDVIDKATLKAEVAASADFADFQSRIAAL